MLDITPSKLCLRLPMVVRHRITQDSPLASWRSGPAGVGGDASSEIVIVVSLPLLMVAKIQRGLLQPVLHQAEPSAAINPALDC